MTSDPTRPDLRRATVESPESSFTAMRWVADAYEQAQTIRIETAD